MATNIQQAATTSRRQAEDATASTRRRWVAAAASLDEATAGPSAGSQQRGKAEAHAAPQTRTRPATQVSTQAVQTAPQVSAAQPERGTARLGMYAVTALLAVLAVYVLVSAVVGWARVTVDDVRYGRPRTSHLEAFVGHSGEQVGTPSHFVALNLDRRVVVIELPGGNTAGATTISGPYLFGEGEELTPALLSAADLNGDGDLDLLLNVSDEQVVYINDRANSTFRLMTAAEHAAILNTTARGGSDPAQDGASR